MQYEWKIYSPNETDVQRYIDELGISRILASKLVNQNISTDAAANIIEANYNYIKDPLNIINIEDAAKKIYEYLQKDKAIIQVFGDYDCDGITSTTILCRSLEELSKKINPEANLSIWRHIPEKVEGYGLSSSFADRFLNIANAMPDFRFLLITVDNGITTKPVVEKLQTANNVEVLVTDHHLPDYENDVTPTSCICVDPHMREDDEGKLLAGCGVIFNVIRKLEDIAGLDHEISDKYIYLVAIGTIGDMMMINTYHACLIQIGLNVINSVKCPLWLQIAKNNLEIRKVTAKDIAFSIAPLINSCGQMGNARLALEALMLDDRELVSAKMEKIYYIYAENKKETKETKAVAENDIENNYTDDKFILYPMSSQYPGLVSKVATHLGKKTGVPLIVWNESEDEEKSEIISGSARNDSKIPAMKFAKEAVANGLLESAEGHTYAFGIKMIRSKIPELKEFLNKKAKEYIEKFGDLPAKKDLKIDCCASTKDINETNMIDIEKIPFIKNLEAPVVIIKDATIKDVYYAKNNPKNVKYTIQSEDSSNPIEIWAWDVKPKEYDPNVHTKIDIVGNIERNFMRPDRATLNVIDLKCH